MLLAIDAATHDSSTRAASFSLFFFMIALNGIWMVIKLELWSHGHRWWFTLDDLREFKLLATRQEKSSTRAAYTVLRYAWHTCFVLMFVVPLTLLGLGYIVSHTH
jgi:hypothetical protein